MKRGHRPSFIPFLRGQSQSGKSAFAAFMLNYFGYDWSYESSMPANFENTGNSIGLKLFTLKDLPLLVDDYHPQSDAQKAKSMAAVAESISRMIGDGAVRDRMRADGTAQTMKPIRALCIETGEETPRVSASSVGRMYVIDVQPGDVPIPRRGMNAAQQRQERGIHGTAWTGTAWGAERGHARVYRMAALKGGHAAGQAGRAFDGASPGGIGADG